MSVIQDRKKQIIEKYNLFGTAVDPVPYLWERVHKAIDEALKDSQPSPEDKPASDPLKEQDEDYALKWNKHLLEGAPNPDLPKEQEDKPEERTKDEKEQQIALDNLIRAIENNRNPKTRSAISETLLDIALREAKETLQSHTAPEKSLKEELFDLIKEENVKYLDKLKHRYPEGVLPEPYPKQEVRKALKEKQGWSGELTAIRNKLFEAMPSGDIKAWDLIIIIKNHLNDLDEFIDNKSKINR